MEGSVSADKLERELGHTGTSAAIIGWHAIQTLKLWVDCYDNYGKWSLVMLAERN